MFKFWVRKQWILFPPWETSYLYPTRIPYEESSVFSEVNVKNPDLQQHPQFQVLVFCIAKNFYFVNDMKFFNAKKFYFVHLKFNVQVNFKLSHLLLWNDQLYETGNHTVRLANFKSCTWNFDKILTRLQFYVLVISLKTVELQN